MTYSYRILIGGVDYSDTTLIDTVSITYGRSDITSQPSPATFSASIEIKNDETIDPIFLTSVIEFQVLGSAWSPVTYQNLFSGTVTDVTASVNNWGGGAGLLTYTITGIGHLGLFNRVNVGTTGFVKQYESVRVDAIATDAAVGGTIVFSDPTGSYEIAAVSNGNYDALVLMQDAANSAMAVLADTPDPDDVGYEPITYITYVDRSTYYADIALTSADIMANGLTISKTLTQIVNKAWVTYGSSSSNLSTIYTDPTSGYSEQTGTRNTYLHNLSDANTVAQTLLAGRTTELYQLTSITCNLSAISDSLIDQLIAVRCGTPITITGLPFDDLTNFNGFIEGWTWNINKNGATITLNLSSRGQLYPFTMWNNVGTTTDTWNTIYSATTTWEDVV